MAKIGAHVSIAGGIQNAPQNAKNLDCECFQMFTRSPHGGKYDKLTEEKVALFLEQASKLGFKPWKDYIVHSPYYINLASANNRIYYGSISAIRTELETASKIKAPFVITHIGSSKDIDGENVQKQINKLVMEGIEKIHENYTGKAQLLLEIAAGSGNIIGDTFEEIGYFVKKAAQKEISLGFCFDTCHSFAAGYDLRTKQQVQSVFKDIDKHIGLQNLKCIHFNDSQGDFDSHVDRHEHIGKGKIGPQGMKAVADMAKALKINLYLETKHDKIKEDLELTKSFRS